MTQNEMKRMERNAILAGLRLLQRNLTELPEGIFEILTDSNDENDSNHLNATDIDALCESLNVAPYIPEGFEVSRVHLELQTAIAERCNVPECNNRHYWAVYEQLVDGRANWISDHTDESHALTAAAAYAHGALDGKGETS